MATYKTPDVYVEEISIFPPSVAEVETAIPAFIGFTEMATKVSTGDLNLVPTRISSLLDYHTYFGGAPAPDITQVKLNDDNSFASVTQNSDFYMYDSLRLFYDNGGGDCYIISIGDYKTGDPTSVSGYKDGLDALEKYDEPTIILYPDAVKLSSNDLYGDLQPATLKQCNDLMDRVAIFDLLEGDPNGTTFRDKVGINYLKYGTAYTPWLKVSLDKTLTYRNIKDVLAKTSTVTLASLTSDTDMKALIDKLDKVIADVDMAAADTLLLQSGNDSLRSKFTALQDAYRGAKNETTFKDIMTFLFSIAETVDGWSTGAGTFTFSDLKNDVTSAISASFKSPFSTLVSYEAEMAGNANLTYDEAYDDISTASPSWGTTFTTAASSVLSSSTDAAVLLDEMLVLVNNTFDTINSAYQSIITAADSYESTFDKSLYNAFPVYKNIIKGINDSNTTMPPSGAVAGVFAATDRDRGVWKAPANVSLASVIGPGTTFTASQLDNLNVNVDAGKSINAIRAFTGKGTLIWGARTLAGNDNEWRYIPVRRFFNMAEESIKKSTYWAVFEPNSASTWVKVRGMIENYLTNKWKDGALVGAKPDEAFFVKIGLGSTMTAQDILEGRMNVEIGMAVVRPAEFIILKFSHKLQQS